MEKQIQYKHKTINYKSEGKGETLVLIHGFMEDLGMWDKHAEELSKSYQVITIDLPGHGKTEIFGASHPMGLLADVVFEVLQAEQVNKCVMVGHSLGGYATLAFADKYPEKLIGFGLFHSHSLEDTEEVKKNRERTIEMINSKKASFINQFIPSLYAKANREKLKTEINHQIDIANKMDPKGITAALEGMKSRPMRLDVLAFSKVPVLFIFGKKDSRIALDQALAQAATASLAQVTILGNSGHMGWLEESSKTIEAIKGFMSFCKA